MSANPESIDVSLNHLYALRGGEEIGPDADPCLIKVRRIAVWLVGYFD